ncbi:MAG TPA: type VI secretion system accessory protein TagJ [Bryobacteraceae bacterium]|nr:type VI secretion system accessory protein TagJ [Bryobacteraceae bacterium]
MTAKELYQAGNLADAIQALGAELRNNPVDTKRRTFLFELLCFAGEYDRAEKQLNILAEGGPDAATGVLMYHAALHADRMRNDLFANKDYPAVPADAAPVSGTFNGKPFESIEDADPRVGPRLEIYAAGQCMWLPLAHIASIEMEAPKRLRDLLWAPALVRTGPAFKGTELGEVLIPVLSPFSFRHADNAVKLGRATVWEEQENGESIPFGQRMLLVDDEEIPILELRRLEVTTPEAAAEHHASAQ